MGQRSQFFVIDTDQDKQKVVYPYYNQWAYGCTMVHSAAKLLEKGHIVQKDGYWYDEKLGGYKALISIADNPFRQFYSKYVTFPEIEETFMGSLDNVDNNDGIGIVDMAAGTYCFMVFDADNEGGLPIYTPLTGEQYLLAYPEHDKEYAAFLNQTLAKYGLMDKKDVLASFPKSKYRVNTSIRGDWYNELTEVQAIDSIQGLETVGQVMEKLSIHITGIDVGGKKPVTREAYAAQLLKKAAKMQAA